MEEVHAREGLVLTVKCADVLSSNGNTEAYGDRWWRNRLFPGAKSGLPMALVGSDTLWEVGMDNASLGGSVLALTLLLQCAGWQWALGKASCALHRV